MMRGAAGKKTVQCAQANSFARKTTGVIDGAGNHSTVQQVSDDRIDFISSYCDRWCERCAYTERCSAYACHMAIEMCGDAEQGLELAIGTPQPEGGEKPEPPGWLADFDDAEPTAEEQAASMAAEAARDERLDALPLATMARVYSLSSFEWLRDRSDALRTAADPVIVEALDIVGHDSVFIGAKIHRAVDGRDRFEHDEEPFADDPVQNDWHGSAKVALISVERSETAWQTIAAASSDPVFTRSPGTGAARCAVRPPSAWSTLSVRTSSS
ncbi:MAG: hypothetical protein DMF98_24390 [Acidobacteria bacterium]|nr:MAG: hypothetical protein DMF98_24390 [Acidobacteriota bacterium]